MRKILLVPLMAGVMGITYFAAEEYGRGHYSLALSNARIVAMMGNFSLPHFYGEQAVYWGSEFVVLPSLGILLFITGEDETLWAEWFALVSTATVGALIFIVFPCAPPWATGGKVVALGDPFGAMPSLHMADAVIVSVCLRRIIRARWAEILGWLYVAFIGYDVISTRNHYPADVVAGTLLGIAAMKLTATRHHGNSTASAVVTE